MSDQATTDQGKKTPRPETAVGILCVDDGYTLRGTARGGEGRPSLEFVYRPALPEDVYEYQLLVGQAKTGEDRLNAQVRLLEAHLVSWSGLYRRNPTPGGSPAAVPFGVGVLADKSVRRGLGADYLTQMVQYVAGYEAGRWEEDAKN